MAGRQIWVTGAVETATGWVGAASGRRQTLLKSQKPNVQAEVGAKQEQAGDVWESKGGD